MELSEELCPPLGPAISLLRSTCKLKQKKFTNKILGYPKEIDSGTFYGIHGNFWLIFECSNNLLYNTVNSMDGWNNFKWKAIFLSAFSEIWNSELLVNFFGTKKPDSISDNNLKIVSTYPEKLKRFKRK